MLEAMLQRNLKQCCYVDHFVKETLADVVSMLADWSLSFPLMDVFLSPSPSPHKSILSPLKGLHVQPIKTSSLAPFLVH